MNFFSYLYGSKGDCPAMDEYPNSPKNETLAEHKKHCKAKPGNCPFERKLEAQAAAEEHRNVTRAKETDKADDVSATPRQEPPTYESVAELYESEGVSDRTVIEARRLYDSILEDKTVPKRIPASVFKTEGAKKLPEWMVLSYLIGSEYQDDGEAQKAVLLDFAEATGNLIPNMKENFEKKYGKRIGKGAEAWVFRESEDKVVKASDLSVEGRTCLQQLERLMISNDHFPETAYSPFAVGQDEAGGLVYGLRQNYIQYDEDNPLTEEEIERWLRDRGWNSEDKVLYGYASKGGDLACLDMHGQNVVQDDKGNIFCLDPCVIPNVWGIFRRSYYNYDDPPKEFDSGEYYSE